MASGEPQPLYTIVGMVPYSVTDHTGAITPGYRVDFRVHTGQSSFVVVPRSATLEEDVHAVVQAEAEQIVRTMARQAPTNTIQQYG